MSIQDALQATPWFALADGTLVIDSGGSTVAIVPMFYATDSGRREAQAQLIAAAPALYAALEACADYLDCIAGGDDAAQKLVAEATAALRAAGG